MRKIMGWSLVGLGVGLIAWGFCGCVSTRSCDGRVAAEREAVITECQGAVNELVADVSHQWATTVCEKAMNDAMSCRYEGRTLGVPVGCTVYASTGTVKAYNKSGLKYLRK